jgi:hypothetical protein
MKAQGHLPTGELQLLLIPEGHWETISVDPIIELPESGGYDAIMVVVDSVGKWSHFIETVTTTTATGAANLYLRNVWKLHSLPWKVISNCSAQFMALFMKELYRLLRIEATLHYGQWDLRCMTLINLMQFEYIDQTLLNHDQSLLSHRLVNFMAYLIYMYVEHIGWTCPGQYQSLLVCATDAIASYSNHVYFHF